MSAYGAPQFKNMAVLLYLAAAWFLIGTASSAHFRNGGYTDFVYYRWLLGLDPTIRYRRCDRGGCAASGSAAVVARSSRRCRAPAACAARLLLVIPPILAKQC